MKRKRFSPLIARRATVHGDAPTTPTQSTQPADSANPTQLTTPSAKDDAQDEGNNLVLVLIVGAACPAVGLVIGLLLVMKRH